eukprot:gb/GFBE01053855.1/.p1 GENE.gb/GFBE01053855.1/~~gb/GFBE01053855.1/.p1  ORF type:complete len:448 (+),score=59.46 gb/GFBE01053855.1/:1-1344(+)
MRWVDAHACQGLCQLILDDRRGESEGFERCGGSRSASSSSSPVRKKRSRNLDSDGRLDRLSHGYCRRPALPSHLWRDCVAPFLSFGAPLPNMLYVFGGRNSHEAILDSVEMFDTWSGRWVPCPPMPKRRSGAGAASLPDGRLIVLGGYDLRGTEQGVLDCCDIYDPATQSWTVEGAPPLRRGRWGHGCAELHGVVYAVGGCSRQKTLFQQSQPAGVFGMETLASMECWRPGSDEWLSCAPLCVRRAGVRVTAVGSRHLLAAGGNEDVFGSSVNLDTVELFDVEKNFWALLEMPLTGPRATAGVAALDTDRVLIVGGSRDARQVESSVEVYEVPASSSCAVSVPPSPSERLPELPEGRMGTHAVRLRLPATGAGYPGGPSRSSIAVVGGELPGAQLLPGTQRQFSAVPVFDVEKMAWRTDTVIPPMFTARTAAAVCVGHGHASLELEK